MVTVAEIATPAIAEREQPKRTSIEAKAYDRQADDVGNILLLDHINLNIGDQRNATVFYVMGLGLTRDPYARVGISNMGVNVGRSQFHLPTAGRSDGPPARGAGDAGASSPQRLRGICGLVTLDLKGLARRLEQVAALLGDTQFSYQVHDDHVDTTCPWGNRFRCHAPSSRFGNTELAIAYIEFPAPKGSAASIARFYREGLLAQARVEEQGATSVASIGVGVQQLLFRETDEDMSAYDGHHIGIYVANHSAPHRFLIDHHVELQEDNAHQYRFRDIIDPNSGKLLFELEHEVRSMKHALFDKPLINRNPDQNSGYRDRGFDEYRGVY